MRARVWIWMLACLLCLAGAWLFWRQTANPRTKPPALQKVAASPATTVHSASAAPNTVAAAATNSTVSAKANPFALRLSNTTKSLDQLTGDRHAILLENAFIDTGSPLNLSIPAQLRSQGDPGAYIVQARGPTDNAFREMLAAAGAQIISYIPNDAYLVRISQGGANGLAADPLTQSVIPYEPYYKISSSMPVMAGQKSLSSASMETNRGAGPSLLVFAVKQAPLPSGTFLTLGLFSDSAAATVAQVEKLGGQIVARDNSPFGPVVRVQPPADWLALAVLPGVQIVEPYHQRVHANDLSRATVGVAADTQVSTNYMNLTGSNVMVEVNDSGIDATHPDFSTGGAAPVRVFGDPINPFIDTLIDTDGHGTHVAGIIAGDGFESMTVTNAQGSIMPATNGQFRGMAPLANLLSMGLFSDSDQELQEAAAQTNALISNNSWNYGVPAYDLAAASYDAAVRDALPLVTGSQPVLFVFAAGNDGGGDDSGGGGNPDTILSPATAKNVVTVGAIEELRNITNIVTDLNGNQSAVWQPQTDTSFQVAGFSSRGNVGIGTEGTYGRYKPDVVAPGTFIVSTRSSEWNEQAYYNPTNYAFNFLVEQVVAPQTLNYYNIFVPGNAVGVIVQIVPNLLSPSPFPTNMPIYVEQADLPTTNTFDFLTTSNEVSIPPNSGGAITGIQDLQNTGFWYAIGNNTGGTIHYDIITEIITTNDLGNYYQVLSNLNNSLGGSPDSTVPPHYYRYDTGTSMSAADVSGVLALIQDYFTNTLAATPSPALLKALVINGARSDGNYDFQVTNSINYQGWGLIKLPNSLPTGMTTNLAASGESMLMLDQNPAAALATGDSHTYKLTLANAATGQPLRITLAWTDPPGDPAAAIKLVNDLNLVVSNSGSGIVYYGNDIPVASIYNQAEKGTNAPVYDPINNVENVYLPAGAGTNLYITVQGYRVNVNAVSAQTNNVVQDYALVISSGNGQVTNAFTVTDVGPGLGIVSNPTTDQQMTFVTTTNAPLLNQLVGASTPLLGTNQMGLGTNQVWGGTNAVVTIGMTNQWHFYVVTNNAVNASGSSSDVTNAAFVTFIPATLSIPRMGVFADFTANGTATANATRSEADIDLYVTTDPTLTNLNPVAISNCVNGAQVGLSVAGIFNGASLSRGGTEFVVDSNSTPGQVYYVGVYSEDQEAAEYGFTPIFTDIPFSQPGPNGSQIVNGVPLPVNIPDGSTAHPGIAYVFGIALYPMQVQQVVVTNTIVHQNFGDLIGTLTHGGGSGLSDTAVLNNHDSLYNPSGVYTNIYDDSGFGNIGGSRTSDGPGNLNNFVGQQGNGVWILTEADTSLTQTGSVTGFNMLIEPHQDLTKGLYGTVEGGSWFYGFVDVPLGATNLTLFATNLTASPLPIFLYVNTNSLPTLTNYIATVGLTNPPTAPPPPPGNSISIGPPLTPGIYWVGIWNPNVAAQNFYIIATLGLGAAPGQVIYTSSGPAPILDDAVITNTIYVTANQAISSVEAALRVDHPRVSDLVFHLISPDGTRCLLVENRGGTTTNGMGTTLAITNIVPATSSGNGSASTNIIDTGVTAGSVQISYNFFNIPDEMVVQYQGTNIFDSGLISGSGVFTVAFGPGTNTQLTIIMNPYINQGSGDLWDYTVNASQVKYTYLVLTEDTTKTITPIKFAPTPFVGVLTNLVTTNVVVSTNALPSAAGWHNSFEGIPHANITAGNTFDGWHVDSGDIDVYQNGDNSVAVGDEGTNWVDLDGNNPGAISTNIATVPGQNYTLAFTYAQNADGKFFGQPVASMQAQQNGITLLSLTLNNLTNTWAKLGWATTSVVFTATAPVTKISFQSLDSPGSRFGVFVDCVNLSSGLNDGFENTLAGDYVQGVNQGFGGWAVTANQVTVISNATLAVEGTNLLALADGTILRTLPTVPGQTYTLSYAYRGPDALGLWRGESNALDSVGSNNGMLINGVTFTNGVVAEAFSLDGTSGYVNIPDSPSLDSMSNAITVDAWMKSGELTANPDWRGIVTKGNTADWRFYRTTGAKTLSWGVTTTINNYVLNGTRNVNDGLWHHVAAVYDGANLLIYVDGSLDASTPDTGLILKTSQPVCIGANSQAFVPSCGCVEPGYFFDGLLDEVSIYHRALSASEILAIYQKGTSGKYNTSAPAGIAQGLAEAQVTVGSFAYPLFFGSNTNWQTNTITFTATQTNTVLQVAGFEPGMLLDDFTMSALVSVTNTVVSTNLNGSDVFYLPEQSLATYAGMSSYGAWQLEVQDDRAGAGLTNTLVSWQLRFNFATPSGSIGTLTNGLPQTNNLAIGSIAYYLITVPTNADIATNILISPNGPLNLWFNPTTPPSGTNSPGDYLFLGGTTNGTYILYTNGVPPLVPGSTYYLGVQNTNAFVVTNFVLTVDFHLIPVPIVLTNGVSQTNTISGGGIVYYLVNVPTNADWATNLLLFGTGPLNVWFNSTNLPAATNPPDVLLFGNATNGISVFGTNTIPTNIVPGGTYYLAVQNPGTSNVTYGIEVDFHLLAPSVPAGSIVYYPITVPTNADFATNILIYASGPLNIWYDTNNPPTTNILLLPDGPYPSGTNGTVVLSASTTPPLIPGSTYYLGVQNTNSFAVSYIIEVDFHLSSGPSAAVITGPTITATNISGTFGYLLQWQGPTNFQYAIQWTMGLQPTVVWNTVLNPVINVFLTSTNGHYSWFDDGSLTGPFGSLRFYRVLGGLSLGTITGSGPTTNTVLAGATSQAVVSVPANALWASNVLLSATGPLYVWFNQTNPPAGSTSAGDFLMLSNVTSGVFVLTSNSVPPLVPGSDYFLGFQNQGTSNVTFVFQVAFGLAPPVSGFGATATNGGIWLKWNGLTNYQYQVQWTTSLHPPALWHTVTNVVLTSTTGLFTWFDDGSLTGGFGPVKFYRLIAYPYLTPIPQPLSISSVTVTNLAGTNDVVLRWSAPTNYLYGVQWTTNLSVPFSNWLVLTNPVLTLTSGVYTFIDNGQTGPWASAKFFRIFEY
ncbi:MAG: S8 family serine peptidase [Verrucomicrobiia bacterium]